jgi:hypothetical protein
MRNKQPVGEDFLALVEAVLVVAPPRLHAPEALVTKKNLCKYIKDKKYVYFKA